MKDRLRQLIINEGLNTTKLAQKIGFQPSAVSHILSGRNKPGFDFCVSLINAFPQYSIEWLMLGKGECKREELAGSENTHVGDLKTMTQDELEVINNVDTAVDNRNDTDNEQLVEDGNDENTMNHDSRPTDNGHDNESNSTISHVVNNFTASDSGSSQPGATISSSIVNAVPKDYNERMASMADTIPEVSAPKQIADKSPASQFKSSLNDRPRYTEQTLFPLDPLPEATTQSCAIDNDASVQESPKADVAPGIATVSSADNLYVLFPDGTYDTYAPRRPLNR